MRIIIHSLLILLTVNDPLFGATSNGTFYVRTTVASACSVNASDIEFGTYASTTVTGTSTLTINCTNGAPYTVSLGVGSGTGASFTNRYMTSGPNQLAYNLYTDNTYSAASIWGDGTASTSVQTGTGSGGNQTMTIYGQLPGGQSAYSGSYVDMVTATITY